MISQTMHALSKTTMKNMESARISIQSLVLIRLLILCGSSRTDILEHTLKDLLSDLSDVTVRFLNVPTCY